MGPPEWGLHRIILFFLYSSSLLCSEPTHVFGRTRWLTLANGNQKRSESNLVVTYPKLRGSSPAPSSVSFLLWRIYPTVSKKILIQPGLSEIRLSSQAAAFVEFERIILRTVGEKKHLPLQRQCDLVVELGFWSQMYMGSSPAVLPRNSLTLYKLPNLSQPHFLFAKWE